MKWLGVLLAIGLLVPAGAQAHTTITEPVGSHFPYQQWVDEAKVPTPEVTIAVIETSAEWGCPDAGHNVAACAVGAPLDRIYIAPEAAARVSPRKTFYHELGHFADYDSLEEWMRSRFMELLRLAPPWRPGPEDASTAPDEVFADSYAQCAMLPYLPRHYRGPREGVFEYGPIFREDPIGGRLTHNKVCRMVQGQGKLRP